MMPMETWILTVRSMGEAFKKSKKSEALDLATSRVRSLNVVRAGKMKWFRNWNILELKTNSSTFVASAKNGYEGGVIVG